MAIQNITSVLTSLNRKVSPGNVNQSRDIFGCLSEAARNLLANITPKELSRRVLIENALYDQINKFKCPDDLDQKQIMQWFRLDGNRNVDTFYYPMMQTTNRRFDQHRIGDRNLFTIEWDKGVRFIKVSDFGQNTNGTLQNNGGLTINTMNSITENGNWQVFGNVDTLVTDNLTFVAGNGSLRFNINTSSNTGGIENFTLTPFSLVDFLTVGKIFTWLDLPNVNQIQTIQLEMFSSPGNGYSITVNSPHDTDAFQEGQNMLGFILDSNVMTTIGSPDPSQLNHIKFTFVTNGTLLMNNVRMDNIVARKGNVFGIQYSSSFIFRDVSGLWKEQPTVGSDEVMLDYDAFQLYMQDAAVILGQEVLTDQGTNRKGQTFGKLGQMQQALAEGYADYRQNYKSEYIPEQQQPYYFGVEFGYGGRDNDNRNRWNHEGEL